MRILSLLPGATEMVCAVGAEASLVGVSHECDHPASVAALPRVTVTPIDPSQASGAIDAQVRAARDAGRAVIGVDAAQLQALAPDLVITQALCDVCAVGDGAVQALAAALPRPPKVLVLGGRTVPGVADDLRAVGAATGHADGAARAADRFLREIEQLALSGKRPRPRVLCLEWVDPPFTAGHWVPDLVHAAGGVDVAAQPGDHSARRTWAELAALTPDVIVVMLCGFDVARSRQELDRLPAGTLPEGPPVWIVDANAYTSRPGPRLAHGARLLRAALEGGPDQEGLARWR
ncbi:MAG: ABC transporter substrate-binding protein [Gemmatimonadales bacterium]|nr:ABC transporter substrate-binding protein [Gemmatimonadales bacterium]